MSTDTDGIRADTREYMMTMTAEELVGKLAGIFCCRPEELTEDTTPGEIQGWDSLAALWVISLMDDSGAGEVSAADAAAFDTVGAIVSFARSRGILGT